MERSGQATAPSAGFVSRAGALAVDALLATMLFAGGLWLTELMGRFLLSRRAWTIDLPAWAVGVAWLGWYAVYQVGGWATVGRTPGKALFGLRVVGPAGARVGILRGLARLVGYAVSSLPLFLGYFWVLVDDARRGWHDHIAGTRVVYWREGPGPAGSLVARLRGAATDPGAPGGVGPSRSDSA